MNSFNKISNDFLFFYVLEPQVHRIETKQAPKPSQPEVVLSDGKCIMNDLFHLMFDFNIYLKFE